MKSKLAIWSFISVIIIIVLGFISGDWIYLKGVIWIFYVLYLIPLILGISALIAINKNKSLTGKGWAIAGIILTIILYAVNLIPLS